MSNIDNKLGTNGAYRGRTSVEAFNDVLSAFSGAGVLSGWSVEPSGGLSVILGGNGTDRDVAIALDNQGNKTTVNNISKQPITITLPSAPASGTRKDNIVAYIDKPVRVEDTAVDNPSAVNIFITSADTDNSIRSAITQDGGAGTNAFYVILASVNLSAGTTDITADMIEQGAKAKIGMENQSSSTARIYGKDGAMTISGQNAEKDITSFSKSYISGDGFSTNLSNGTITALKDGDILVSWSLFFNNASGIPNPLYSVLGLKINGGPVCDMYAFRYGTYGTLGGSVYQGPVKAGDVLKIYFAANIGGGSIQIPAGYNSRTFLQASYL